MRISKELAQVMVKAIRDIIDKDLNFIDTNSIIIASTDSSRIGQKHDGAIDVLKNGKDVVISNNDQYPGAKMGINIPVMFHNKPIGVFGITGNPDEVTKYGELLKKLTEILVNDAYLQENVYKDRFNEQLMVETIIFFSSLGYSDNEIETFNYNESLERRVVYGMINAKKTVDENQIFRFMKAVLNPATMPLISINNNMIVMLLVDTPQECDIERELLDLNAHLLEHYNIEGRFAVGTIFSGKKSAKDSFYRAKNLFTWLDRNLNFGVKVFEKSELGIIISSIDSVTQQIFVSNILKQLSNKEIDEFYQTLKAYEKYNGSITQTANELNIHKNTLQYRLNKLSELTGFNPRDLSGFCTLKIAFMLNS